MFHACHGKDGGCTGDDHGSRDNDDDGNSNDGSFSAVDNDDFVDGDGDDQVNCTCIH